MSPNELTLAPYAQIQGQWTLPDETVLAFGRRMRADGTFDTVFYEGHVRTPEELLGMLKKPANVPVFCFRGLDPICLAWLNSVAGNYAFGHFCFAKSAWGVDTLEAGQMCVRYWMQTFEFLDTILGVCPKANYKACGYVQKLGFKPAGEVPGMLRFMGSRVPASIFYYSRVEHEQEKPG